MAVHPPRPTGPRPSALPPAPERLDQGNAGGELRAIILDLQALHHDLRAFCIDDIEETRGASLVSQPGEL